MAFVVKLYGRISCQAPEGFPYFHFQCGFKIRRFDARIQIFHPINEALHFHQFGKENEILRFFL